jgi:hypothetical protein
MITLCDELHTALSAVVTSKLLDGDKSRKKKQPSLPAAEG